MASLLERDMMVEGKGYGVPAGLGSRPLILFWLIQTLLHTVYVLDGKFVEYPWARL